ncbi:MAG: D-alanine--D-alanine ligase [Candidatus Moraniibacteriota bacterium]
MEKKKINVGILFGGRSAEHEISLQSAKNILSSLDRKKYNPVLIGIDKSGVWRLYDEANFLLNENDPIKIKLNTSEHTTALIPGSNGALSNTTSLSLDVVFPALHGPFGEDGTIQGILRLANIPFVGANILGSAIGMDKDVMKRLLRDANIPIAKFITLNFGEEIPSYESVQKNIGIPCFIKPANLGSTIGVGKAHNKIEYLQNIQNASMYDSKIIIEEYIKGREIECAVLGNESPIASIVGEIIPLREFYSYEAKYIDKEGAYVEIPAKISDELIEKVHAIAIKTFKTLSCEGLGRVDMFLTDKNEIIVNEINTMPGFTKISMYPKLWEASGISYTELISRLIDLAMERFKKEQMIQTHYALD